jgi:hydroxymethylpyrimidine kinase / phosphomethylpyrimidine kinase / thiamine-phosphate diphosphorylase
MRETHHPCILSIAGSDSGGGAGIQADLKTIFALGGYGLTVVTALTAQNTRGVSGISAPEPGFVALQLKTVLDDFPVAAAKTGMLFSREIIAALAPLLERRGFPLVVDPVCVSQSGHKLLQDDAIAELRSRILPLADLITPNRPEAELLAEVPVRNEADVRTAIGRLLEGGAGGVLLKGGHFEAKQPRGQAAVVTDWLGLPGQEPVPLTRERIDTRQTHGTGCTLSAAIAALLGYGLELTEAVEQARDHLHLCLRGGYELGGGQGPVSHLAPLVLTRGRLDVLEVLHWLAERLVRMEGLGALVPEVRMNIALAAPFARGVHDVAAFEGRIRRAWGAG